MPTQGPFGPSVVQVDSSFGSTVWAAVSAVTTEDGICASSDSSISQYLKGTFFGFSIPTGAIILGIQLEIKRKDAGGTSSVDVRVRLVKNAVVQTTDKASGSTWPNTLAFATYGSGSDLWGDVWTADDINQTGFGFALSAQSGTPNVDYARMTVTYQMPNNFSVNFQHA